MAITAIKQAIAKIDKKIEIYQFGKVVRQAITFKSE